MGRFALAADSKARHCSFGDYLAGLDEDDRDELLGLASRHSMQSVRDIIVDVDGRSFDRHTIQNHLAGRCICRAS